MGKIAITEENLEMFRLRLYKDERSPGTIEKYLRDVRNFARWLNDTDLTQEAAICWKEHLIEGGYNPITINSMISAVNTFLNFIGMNARIKFLRVQKQLFRDEKKELSREEYQSLIETAKGLRKNRLALELSARITAYEERKKHQRYYKAWEKLPEHKRLAFEKQYEFELRKYRDAGEALQRWQDNGETIDYKGWQKALKYVSATIHNLFTAYLPAAKVRLRMTDYHFHVSSKR